MKQIINILWQNVAVVIPLGVSISCASKSVESIVGGVEVYKLIAELHKAKTCEVYRVDDSYPGENRLNKANKIHGFFVLSEVHPMKDDAREALSQILLKPNTYFEYAVPIDCAFRPGIAFRFTSETTEVDLLVCFSCNELRYYLDGKSAGESYFKSADILTLTKKLFPDDKKIQSLK